MDKSTRIRIKPRLYDYSYSVCKRNLRELKNLIKNTPLKKIKKLRVLDVGCGKKPFQSLFLNADYIGIDFTKDDTFADIIVDMNKDKLPFKKESFDIVIVSEAIEHIFNNRNLSSEIKRVTKKKGFLFITGPFNCAEHGAPHDYYRFTKYYYFKMFDDLTLIKYDNSNSNITMPFLTINQIIAHIPIISLPFITLNNIIVELTEFLLKPLKKIKDYLLFLTQTRQDIISFFVSKHYLKILQT